MRSDGLWYGVVCVSSGLFVLFVLPSVSNGLFMLLMKVVFGVIELAS